MLSLLAFRLFCSLCVNSSSRTFLPVGSGKIEKVKLVKMIPCSFTFLFSSYMFFGGKIKFFESFCFLIGLVPLNIFFQIPSRSPFMGLGFYGC